MTTKLEPEIYKGAHLASMFAYPAVSSGSCNTKIGQKQASKYLVQYILSFSSGKPEERYEEVLEVLEPLDTLGPYLRAIAKEMKLDPLHIEVVEAYILGKWSEDLNTGRVFENLLDEMSKVGKTKTFLDLLKQKAPQPFLPFHGYETLLNGLGTADTEKLGGATNCMVREGLILKTNQKNKATVVTKCLKLNHKEGRYVFQNCKSEVLYDMSFLEYVVVDSKMRVAIHQGWIVDILDKEAFSTLSNRNVQTVKLFKKFGL